MTVSLFTQPPATLQRASARATEFIDSIGMSDDFFDNIADDANGAWHPEVPADCCCFHTPRTPRLLCPLLPLSEERSVSTVLTPHGPL